MVPGRSFCHKKEPAVKLTCMPYLNELFQVLQYEVNEIRVPVHR